MDAVIFQQMGQMCGAGKIVDRHDLDIRDPALKDRT